MNDTPRTPGREDFHDRRAERAEKLEARAEKHAAKADSLSASAMESLRQIPPGQPILVGHHSEKRHRSHLSRVDSQMRRSVEASEKAAAARSSLQGMDYAGISSDDPEALVQLREKIAELEETRSQMKAINAAYRKAKRPALGDVPGWAMVVEAVGDTALLRSGIRTLELCPYEKAPFPQYSLSNIGARVKATQKRIDAMEWELKQSSRADEESDLFTLSEDQSENRVALYPKRRLSKEEFQQVRQSGFVWSRANKRFQRLLNASGWAAGQRVLSQVKEPEA